jgi:hypothetical protein
MPGHQDPVAGMRKIYPRSRQVAVRERPGSSPVRIERVRGAGVVDGYRRADFGIRPLRIPAVRRKRRIRNFGRAERHGTARNEDEPVWHDDVGRDAVEGGKSLGRDKQIHALYAEEGPRCAFIVVIRCNERQRDRVFDRTVACNQRLTCE